ncbi:MAG: ThuA domain-containing protein [Halanaerobiales bacterium]
MIRVLILVGGEEQYHDVLSAGDVIQKELIDRDVVAKVSQDFSILTAERFDRYDLCIFYTQSKKLTREEQKALKDRIAEGKGFIAIHAANVINDVSDNQVYLETIGSKFVEHDPFKRFYVNIEKDHYITTGIDGFEIDDELYVTESYGDPVQILATAEQDGKEHPMLYVKTIDRGRVCYIALGHDGRAWYNPGFQELLYRSVLWCAGKDS